MEANQTLLSEIMFTHGGNGLLPESGSGWLELTDAQARRRRRPGQRRGWFSFG